jgi:hypothetical protein
VSKKIPFLISAFRFQISNGWPGWFYVFQRTLAEMLLSLRLMEEKLAEQSAKR